MTGTNEDEVYDAFGVVGTNEGDIAEEEMDTHSPIPLDTKPPSD